MFAQALDRWPADGIPDRPGAWILTTARRRALDRLRRARRADARAEAPSPVVELNRAVAIGLARGPLAGLAALDAIDVSALREYHLLPAARADFLRRLGRRTEAASEYRRALGMADNAREQAFYERRLAACDDGVSDRER